MSTINIQVAERAGARLVVGLSGISGSGKTLTALLLAYGMVDGDGSKVGLLCTENRRGRLYASRDTYEKVRDQLGMKSLPKPFLVGDLEPPFSPKRYVDAILQFQQAGVKVLVVDSVSHEWEGIGGCEEIAERGAVRGMKDWKTAKREHREFMNALLQSDMHIIPCIRAREKVKYEKVNGKTEVTPLGILPVCEKNFMFEMTASLMMWDKGRTQTVAKCPEELAHILGREKDYITAADGRALAQWVDGGVQLDPEIEHARNTLRTASAGGMDEYRKAFDSISPKARRALNADGTHESLKTAAEAFDAERLAGQPGGKDLADLNEEIEAGD
jgi:hypothetical protein